MGKFNFNESPVKKVAEEIRDNNVEQATQSVIPAPQPAVSTPRPVGEGLGEGPLGEVLKNVGAKIPYTVYEGLERIKRQSERSGIKADKRSIGDLVAQAIKEFVERNG